MIARMEGVPLDIRAIAFDLDDTMLRDDRTLSAESIRVIREAAAKGCRIIPASGRARDSMRSFVEEFGCADAYIACNGAEVWSPRHELLMRLTFPDETSQEILSFVRAHGSYAQTYSGDHFYYLEESEWAPRYAASSMLTGFYTPDLESFIREHPTSKILLMDREDRVARMLTEARERFAGRAAVTCSKPYFLEFNPTQATKGNALAFCAENLGFSLGETMAFGDSLNDLSMLERVGCGVAVGNAREDVRSRVSHVCGTNEENGPARFIAQHVLGEETAR